MINEKQGQSEGVIITETVKNLNASSHSIWFLAMHSLDNYF